MKYLCMISDYTHKIIMALTCEDITKMWETFEQLNTVSLNWPPENYLNRLVYFEQINDDEYAKKRLDEVFKLTLEQKRAMIADVNPDWIDLSNWKQYALIEK